MSSEPIAHPGALARLYRSAPSLDGLRTAAIGGFRCESTEAGAALLGEICGRLKARGFGAVLGPMDGDTWHSYRLVIKGDGSAPFLLEPTSGAHDLSAFAQAGFEEVGRYFSARVPLDRELAPLPAPPAGIAIKTWNGADPEGCFAEVHALSCEAFARNAFYTPISRAAFLAMYMPLVPMLRPELLLLARDGAGRLQGFFFAIPNYQEGRAPSSVIMKTYASRVPGLGHAMLARAHGAAREMGFAQAIHALIHDQNRSADRSRREGATPFRHYALMGRRLGSG
jgi:hypothetical protein